MNLVIISEEEIDKFCLSLEEQEKSIATIKKYVAAIHEMKSVINKDYIVKKDLIKYRLELQKTNKPRTVNVKLVAINSYLKFVGAEKMKLNLLRIQKNNFIDEEKKLTEEEYKRLLKVAKSHKNGRIYYIMITICATGIRVSELKYITVEAIKNGSSLISMKGKERIILIPEELKQELFNYIEYNSIKSGSIFLTKGQKSIDRSNICKSMKNLCDVANVDKTKVFPHNLRHLFASTFYKVDRNLVELADILGHSNIDTTRIYVATTAQECREKMGKMNLIL